MTIAEGDRLPDAQLLRLGENGRPEPVTLSSLTAGKTVALFGLPGAYTGVCTNAHLPSFIRTMDRFAEKGVDTVICVAVNDPFVMNAWGDSTGAAEAGIHMLGDPGGDFIKEMGLDFDAPPAGFFGRSKRFSMLVDDGAVRSVDVEDDAGTCSISAGEALLEKV